ncbi:hypothetical protein D9M68_943430 [compost metagenome]
MQAQVACDVDVRRAHLRARGEVGERQRHIGVVRHQAEHALVEAAQRQAHQPTEMAASPAVVGFCGRLRGVLRHPLMVRQTDQIMPRLLSTRL